MRESWCEGVREEGALALMLPPLSAVESVNDKRVI